MTTTNQPQSCADLFWSFNNLSLQGFGGVLGVVQRELVEKKKWLKPAEFVEDWAVAQIMPGPNVLNLAVMIGGRSFGIRGAASAVAGMLLFPSIIVLILACLFISVADIPAAQGALKGMSAVSAGLIFATGLKLIPALRNNPLGQKLSASVAVIAFVAVAIYKVPLVWVVFGLGGASCFWAWLILKASHQRKHQAP